MSLTRQVAHNTIVQMIGKVISTFLGVVAIAMMTRYLGAEKFGWYTTTITFLQFVGILTDFGLIPVTAQMLSEGKHESKKLFQNLFGFRLVTALICFGVAPLISLFFNYPVEVKIAIAINSLAYIGIALNQVFVGYYQHRLKMHVQAIAEVAGRTTIVVGLYGVMFFGASFLPVMIVLTLANLVHTCILFFTVQKETSLRPRFDWDIFRSIAHKMWPIALSIIFNVVYLKGDILLLTFYRSQTEVGIYGSAYRVIDILTQTAMLFMGVTLPLLTSVYARHLHADWQKRYQKIFEALLMMAAPILVGTFLLSTPLMRLIAGQEFIAAGVPLRILSLAVFGVYLGAFFGHVAVAMNEQKRTIWIYATTAVLTLTGYLIFIPLYGMIGAAWMSVFSELLVGILLGLVVHRVAKVKLNLLPFIKIILASGIMGGILFLVKDWPVLVLILLGAVVYGGVLLLSGALTKETVKEILRLKG